LLCPNRYSLKTNNIFRSKVPPWKKVLPILRLKHHPEFRLMIKFLTQQNPCLQAGAWKWELSVVRTTKQPAGLASTFCSAAIFVASLPCFMAAF
jgi:hypothetical protein